MNAGKQSGAEQNRERLKILLIAGGTFLMIAGHVLMRYGLGSDSRTSSYPLIAALILGGSPLVFDLLRKAFRREFGSDLLAGISIVTSVLLGEYLAGTIVVLMLSGGEALESYAVRHASSALRALASRMPSIAHLKAGNGIRDVALDEIRPGDLLAIYPHEICPADGLVREGKGVMNEAFLTGEPFEIPKVAGSSVISGAINGDSALVIEATKRPADSRYAKIMEVMRESEQTRPRLRRLGDQLGAIYTPLAVAIAVVAWLASGDPVRFLAVLVIATPCPLLIAIPVSIIGSISLAAQRSIIIKNPLALEQIPTCRTAIFDKTGTLTYGEPKVVEQIIASPFQQKDVLTYAASLEVYSKHPLAKAILYKAREQSLQLVEAAAVSELPGQGLKGVVDGKTVQITSRSKLLLKDPRWAEKLPPLSGGLECVILVDGALGGVFRLRDAPRSEGHSFIEHLGPKHQFHRIMILSGDRKSEVEYLADQLGITEVHAEKSPEEKLAIVRCETEKAKTLYVGDGINDAPAMAAATVGMAMGQNSDVAAAAAGVVAMENSLKKVDEFLHISRRMRTIALQSAVGGMALSVAGMILASFGLLTPVAGAIGQEIIDVLAVLNALRAAFPPKVISHL